MVETYRLNAAGMVVVHCLRGLVRERRRPAPATLPAGQIIALEAFLEALDRGARRRILLGDGPATFATADEAAMVALIADAQARREEACEARALFLARPGFRHALLKAARAAAAMLDDAGLAFDPPQAAPANAFSPLKVVSSG